MKGTSCFVSCRLFDSLMCRRQSHDSLWCFTAVCVPTTASQTIIAPYWLNWLDFLSTYPATCYIYKRLKHKFPFPALCHSQPPFSLDTSAFASVSKCFISSLPSVHHTLCCLFLHLSAWIFLRISHCLSLSIPSSYSCGWAVWLCAGFPCTTIRNGQRKIPVTMTEELGTTVCTCLCVRAREGR